MILKYMEFLYKVRRALGKMFIAIGEHLLQEHRDWWEDA